MNEQVIGKENPLGTERIGKLMLRYAVPSIISLVVNSLYNMVDQIFIGQGVGYLGNAATNVILPLTTFLLALGLMVGDGTATFMSLSLGKGKADEAAHGVGHAVTLTVGIGIILTVIFELFLQPLCRLFGATDAVMPYALEYGGIIILGFAFSAVDSAFGSILRADGRPKVSMAGLLIGCITNIILDPVFIFVFHWGVKGAAWARIIGQFLNAVFYIGCMFSFKCVKLKKQHSILTLSADTEVETQESREDTIWHELQNAYRTRKILTGTLGGIEKTEGGGTIAVVYFKEMRVVIPLAEMMINLVEDAT